MSDYKGSTWSKWDLHVHTPDSIVSNYKGDWENFITDIENLPDEFKVIGINDYIFLDGYRRVLEEQTNGRMQNIELFLPVIELRVDKFGGTNNKLSRVNFHVIFNNSVTADCIEQQFLAALGRFYQVVPEYSSLLNGNGSWNALLTKQSLEDLGKLIIQSVPKEERKHYSSAFIEGFNNFNVSLDKVYEALDNSYLSGKYLTAVGKTEWANIKWNDQSIADKKHSINKADLVFISSDTVENFNNSKQSLVNSSVNSRLLDCSDAHDFSDATIKDRIGKCFTWVKSDCTFEGLRQALCDFENRVVVSESEPLSPPLRIDKVKLNFPSNTVLKSDKIQDTFCYRGNKEVAFSPYLTCLIGGRGSGKSTLINLLHEMSKPHESDFFKNNHLKSNKSILQIEDYVDIDSTVNVTDIEYLSQNSIEEFAKDSEKLKKSIFTRLVKLDASGTLKSISNELNNVNSMLDNKHEKIAHEYSLTAQLENYKKELDSNEKLVLSFGSGEYKKLNESFNKISESFQSVIAWKKRFESLSNDIESLVDKYGYESPPESNPYLEGFKFLYGSLAALNRLKPSEFDGKSDSIKYELELKTLLDSKRKELDSYLSEKGLSQENLTDVSNASSRINELKEEITQFEFQLKLLKMKINKFNYDDNLRNSYERSVTIALEDINDKLHDLSSEVKPIFLKYEWNLDSFKNSIFEYLYNRLKNKSDSPPKSHHLKQILEEIDILKIENKNSFLENFSGDRQVAKTLHEYFTDDCNFDQFMNTIEKENLNTLKHGGISIDYDGRPVQHSSFGQRCTAAIVVLIMLGNTPLVIDEPEAHLDSSLIAKYLVELIKNVKINRQLIFATHNANFVINGDAELIHILDVNDKGETEISSTSIENLKYRERLLSLEGGLEAFKQRERRYN